jgi:hypothetical protein
MSDLWKRRADDTLQAIFGAEKADLLHNKKYQAVDPEIREQCNTKCLELV